MNDLIKLLDRNLEYINHNIEKDTIYINVKSIKKEVKCPYCNNYSTKVHSKYKKSFQDLPIQGMKVTIIINNRKMFCKNGNCNHTTFSEKFKFISDKAKRTKRLEEKIIRLSLNMSSISASNYLKKNLVDVSKSTICTLLKKKKC